MGNVVDIATQRPHTTGPALCHDCGHAWTAVVPVATLNFKCPECKSFKGLRQGFVLPSEDFLICTVCETESHLFSVYVTDGLMLALCANCGDAKNVNEILEEYNA